MKSAFKFVLKLLTAMTVSLLLAILLVFTPSGCTDTYLQNGYKIQGIDNDDRPIVDSAGNFVLCCSVLSIGKDREYVVGRLFGNGDIRANPDVNRIQVKEGYFLFNTATKYFKGGLSSDEVMIELQQHGIGKIPNQYRTDSWERWLVNIGFI